VLLSGASVVVALTGGDQTTSTALPIPLPAGAAPPEAAVPAPPETSAELEQLKALLPPEVVNCEESPDVSVFNGAVAGLTCFPSPPVPDVFVAFVLFPSEEMMLQSYEENSPFGTSGGGDCAAGEPGAQPWSGAGGKGQLACFVPAEPPTANLLWTSDGFPILGWIHARDPAIPLQTLNEIWQGISDYPR
jgi:hypothetical protein